MRTFVTCCVILVALIGETALSFSIIDGTKTVLRRPYRKQTDLGVETLHVDRLYAAKPMHSSVEMSSDNAMEVALEYLQNREANKKIRKPRWDSKEYGLYSLFENSPKFEVDLERLDRLEEEQRQKLLNKKPSASELFLETKRQTIEKWRQHETDVGSSEVQVAIADERVKYLTRHMLANKHDNSAKRGLQAVVVTRRKFLDDLYRRDANKATAMAAELGIRFRPKGRFWDKSIKYAAYKNTKHKYIYTEDGREKRVK